MRCQKRHIRVIVILAVVDTQRWRWWCQDIVVASRWPGCEMVVVVVLALLGKKMLHTGKRASKCEHSHLWRGNSILAIDHKHRYRADLVPSNCFVTNLHLFFSRSHILVVGGRGITSLFFVRTAFPLPYLRNSGMPCGSAVSPVGASLPDP